jgi:5-methylcytosine-specific restriction protein A
MFEDLRRAIDTVDVGGDPERLRAVMRLSDRLRARIAEGVGEFDALDMAELDGATSTTAWLLHNGRMTGREAQRLAVIGRSLTELPAHAEALRAGRISWGQVELLLSVLGQRLVEAFASIEATVAPLLEPLDMEATAVLAARVKAGLEDLPEPDEARDRLHLSSTFAGRGVGDFELSSESFAIVDAAIRVALSPDVEGEPARELSERRAHSLVDVCQFFLDHRQADTSPNRNRAHVSLVIEAADLAGSGSGHVLDGSDVLARSSVEAFLCDCSLNRVVMAGSSLLDYGTLTQTISKALWGALVVRDDHCRFPGCDRRPLWCDAHHVVWFSQGGLTRPDNLVLLCRRHHRLLHKPGWSARLSPSDATFEVTDPKGVLRVSHPPWWQSPLAA